MHVPDGFLDAPTSVATGVVAAGAVALALRKSHTAADDRVAPLAGLTAAFVFAAQMLNFPVGVGTSGHLLGGALAAILVGPWTAMLVITVVLMVQALLFADGGITALGTNITLMAVVTVGVGWLVARGMLRVLPKRPTSVVPASFVAALVSVPVSAAVFVGLFAIGGNVDLSLRAMLAAMTGWHILIGIGEAAITALTVGAVVAVRPDLVFAARDLRPALELRTADGFLRRVEVPGAASQHAGTSGGGRSALGWFAGVGIAVALFLAGIVSFYASGSPDGLERVAEDHGFAESARDSAAAQSPFADYAASGVSHDRLSILIAGVVGVLVTVAIAVLVARVANRRRSAGPSRQQAGPQAGEQKSERVHR